MASRSIATTQVPVPANLRPFYSSSTLTVRLHGTGRKGRSRKPRKLHGQGRHPDPFKHKGLGKGQ